MIPPEFEYAVPESLADAIRLLDEGGEDAKPLAGGHSLIPLMKLRLAAPSLLVKGRVHRDDVLLYLSRDEYSREFGDEHDIVALPESVEILAVERVDA